LARRGTAPPPPQQPVNLTPEQMRQGIERIQKRLDEVSAFEPTSVTEQYNIPHVEALAASVDEALVRTFGVASPDYKRYSDAAQFDNGPHNYAYAVPIQEVHKTLARCKARSLALLKQAIVTLEERIAEANSSSVAQVATAEHARPRRVFVVHGHDDGTREAVARFLERIGFEAVILHERANKGRTIITKFREEAADIGFAVVLMTPDDHGGKAGEATSLRARQNVVFELGFFIALSAHKASPQLLKGT
jgi:hypothetical protein